MARIQFSKLDGRFRNRSKASATRLDKKVLSYSRIFVIEPAGWADSHPVDGSRKTKAGPVAAYPKLTKLAKLAAPRFDPPRKRFFVTFANFGTRSASVQSRDATGRLSKAGLRLPVAAA
jgi:hypothetical protein